MQQIDHRHITVTIPAYKEPDIVGTLISLLQCDRSGLSLKIMVLINNSVDDTAENKQINVDGLQKVNAFITENHVEKLIFVQHMELPPKHAGVGLARKTVMDEAAENYKASGINGIILALDADCTVSENYLLAVSDFFSDTTMEAASIHYEHPFTNIQDDSAIIEYEWHLRYFIRMQAWCKFPFAYQTVGSSMACTSNSYLAKGGMNKRKAGEDFYFLHKFIKDGVCGKITNTTVFPSGRISDRVPFGTGRAMGKYELENYVATTYNPLSFMALQSWNQHHDEVYNGKDITPESYTLRTYLEKIGFETKVAESRKNTASKESFSKRFYQFFDAFQLMKCLHYMRDEFPDIPIAEANRWYAENMLEDHTSSIVDTLHSFRKSFY